MPWHGEKSRVTMDPETLWNSAPVGHDVKVRTVEVAEMIPDE